MTSAAKKTPAPAELTEIEYPDTDDNMGEDALHGMITELLRPLLQLFLTERAQRAAGDTAEPVYVGSDQFLYCVERNPKKRIAPDIYVIPGVSAESEPYSWFLWELKKPTSFALEIVGRNVEKDYKSSPAIYASTGVQELLVFDPEALEPRTSPRARVRFRWQVWRTIAGHGWKCVEASNEDRVYSRSLQCWFRLVLVNDKQRIRVAIGPTGDELVPNELEREQEAKLRADAEKQALEEKYHALELAFAELKSRVPE